MSRTLRNGCRYTSFYTPHLSIPVVVDSNLRPRRTLIVVNDADIVVCETREDVLRAMESVVAAAQDPGIIMDTPDVIVEGTGNPEVGAQNVLAPLNTVAMVNGAETDSVGAQSSTTKRAGLVYTPVDGDQHGLPMHDSAETIGLNVISAVKPRREYIYHPGQGVVMVEADVGCL